MEKIETITAKELYNMRLPPTRFVVDGLLPRGLHVFAGAPKVGKSWLLLQLALAVASGTPLWGLRTEQGTVLSLCLEDNYSRLQQRISELTDEPPEELHLATFSQSLADGLCDQLEDFLAQYGDTNLIIIDTLQKVRGGTGDGNLYASDYQDIGMLKRIADEHQIAVILVHHLRKREAGDPHMMISGTTGLIGAADSSYVLCKEHPNDVDVQLHVRGRDMEEKTFTLERDEELGEWTLMKCDTPLTDPLENETALRDVAAYVRKHRSFEGTASELVHLLDLDMQPNILTRKIGRYRQELQRLGVSFTPSRTGKQRTILLRYHSYYDDMTISRCGEGEPSQSAETVANTCVAL